MGSGNPFLSSRFMARKQLLAMLSALGFLLALPAALSAPEEACVGGVEA